MENRDELIKDLAFLRTRRGLTLGRLEDRNALLSVLGGGSLKEGYYRLVAALNGLGEDMHAQALRNAFGLGPSKDATLLGRRSDFGLMNGGRHVDTVEAWEDKMLEELVTALMAGEDVPEPRLNLEAVLFVVDGVPELEKWYEEPQETLIYTREYKKPDRHLPTYMLDPKSNGTLSNLKYLRMTVTFTIKKPAECWFIESDSAVAFTTGKGSVDAKLIETERDGVTFWSVSHQFGLHPSSELVYACSWRF